MQVAIMLWYLLIPPVFGSYCTPSNPDFDEFRYDEEIAHCRRVVSTWKKDQICARDGVTDRTEFTVDHVIPLSLGGSNEDDNLWCQHRSLAITRLENEMFYQLRDGEITQEEAVQTVLDAKFNVN